MVEIDTDRFGPIDYLVIEFDDAERVAAGFDLLNATIDNGSIHVLDLEFVTKVNGEVTRATAASFGVASIEEFAGAASGLLDANDLAVLGETIADGSSAAILVYEELSMFAVVDAWTDGGARLVLGGQVTPEELEAALDATETTD